MTPSVRPLIAGNWKMNGLKGDGLALVKALADKAATRPDLRPEIVLCPPATLLALAVQLAGSSGVKVGGQDCHAQAKGAHTGDISAEMLADLGCSHVIVGHSERREDHKEGNLTVRAKAEAAHRAGLTAILCLGESAEEREGGKTLDRVGRQLDFCLPRSATPANTVIAYEPIWAIGSGRIPTLDEVAEVHKFLRGRLGERMKDGAAARILYGGSAKPANAGELLGVKDVDGLLVGGASLQAEGFWQMIEAAAG